MGKGRFVNQKLGKRMSRKAGLIKAKLSGPKLSVTHSKPPVSNLKAPVISKSHS
jgi:hypothetical protein